MSDICGLQYDPNPTIHLNHYMMLWNRKKDFAVEDLDAAAYQAFKITEAFAFNHRGIEFALQALAAFHGAEEIVERGSFR